MDQQQPNDLPNDDSRESGEASDAQMSAHALGQTDGEEREAIEARLRGDADDQQMVEETRRLAGMLSDSLSNADHPRSTHLRTVVERRLSEKDQHTAVKPPALENNGRRGRRWMTIAIAICTLVLVGVFAREIRNDKRVGQTQMLGPIVLPVDDSSPPAEEESHSPSDESTVEVDVIPVNPNERAQPDASEALDSSPPVNFALTEPAAKQQELTQLVTEFNRLIDEQRYAEADVLSKQANKLAPEEPVVQNLKWKSQFVRRIREQETVQGREEGLYNQLSTIDDSATPFDDAAPRQIGDVTRWCESSDERVPLLKEGQTRFELRQVVVPDGRRANTEQYDRIVENEFTLIDRETAVSTFSIDVDTASYANVRRFLTHSTRPPADAVRIEELINYFNYDYPQPKGAQPFSVNLEVARCPWRQENMLLRVGLAGEKIDAAERPASNLVFLLDVSGSMSSNDKLPLLKQAMKMLTNQLTENDRVAIVTYAGNAGLQLDSITGDRQDEILDAIDALNSGGSTNGSAGIQLAYQKAVEHFIDGGTNRVILATDGDLNVGITADDQLVQLIQEKASSGVFLTVLGFGTGNLKDSKLEKLADHGNGQYGYIDSFQEARKVLVEQISGNLVTIAKDVKIQIEFNPVEVQAYRLIGYENRVMPAEDFHDDTKDAGEIGAGHTVTALYELVPANGTQKERVARATRREDALRYQKTDETEIPPEELTAAAKSGELFTLSLRYKKPDSDVSALIEVSWSDQPVSFGATSDDFQFASAVAAFGMLLRNSKYAGDITFSAIEEIAGSALGPDTKGRRTEFVDLVRKAQELVPVK